MEIKTIWTDIIKTSTDLIKSYKVDEAAMKENVKTFADQLVVLSETFVSNRMGVLEYIRDQYPKLILNATNLMSLADSVAIIMQLNEGINDYLILVNVFRGLMVLLDTMASNYWLKLSERYFDQPKTLKQLIQKTNYAIFDKDSEEQIEVKADLAQDNFFAEVMNKQLWKEIKELDEKYILKNQENFEYFKELLTSTEHMANDMVINLWAVLAIGFCYLDYLNNLLGE